LFHNLENWSYIDSFYFSSITLTTVGFGDLVPTHNISKIITSIYTILGVGTFLFCLGVVSEYYFYKRFMAI
jgi:voltage-gated potassium channel